MDPAVLLQKSPEAPAAKSVGETLLSLSFPEDVPSTAANHHGIIVQVNSHTVFCTTGGSCGSSNA
jgi:hypothetical protein